MKIEFRKLTDIKPYEHNPRRNDAAVAAVAESIRQFGFRQPIVVDAEGVIICGHTRYKAANKLGLAEVPVHVASELTPTQVKALRLADNKTHELAEWDRALLPQELQALLDDGFDIESIGFSADDIDTVTDTGGDPKTRTLSDRFLVPPFTVLDARQGYWQDRKEEWLNLGIQSELGRHDENASGGGGLTYSTSSQPIAVYKAKETYEAKVGRKVSWEEFYEANPDAYCQPGTSIFDPVLCELIYRWFCPPGPAPGGTILDPFAGGSVRGIVASRIGRQYVGVELRAEQVEANRAQAERICTDPIPVWIEGDSRDIRDLAKDVQADLVFSCPPYADLERYSDDPRDLSTKQYAEFRQLYSEIIQATCAMLKPNRFACFVVGDLRDKAGFYRDFPMHTIEAFESAGLRLYNDAVLVTQLGSLPVRVAGQFTKSRKLGKTHQNVQLFYKGTIKEFTKAFRLVKHHENVMLFAKGSPEAATAACGQVEVTTVTED